MVYIKQQIIKKNVYFKRKKIVTENGQFSFLFFCIPKNLKSPGNDLMSTNNKIPHPKIYKNFFTNNKISKPHSIKRYESNFLKIFRS